MPQTSRTVVPFAADAIRGVEEMTSQKPAKSRFSASAENNFSFLTRPQLLRSESEQEFNQLLSGLKAEIQPNGFIEDMYVVEYCHFAAAQTRHIPNNNCRPCLEDGTQKSAA